MSSTAAKPVSFEFEGRTITGFKGDTIASALAANDQWMISRSFKYHRPRGVLTMAGQDANTLVQVAARAQLPRRQISGAEWPDGQGAELFRLLRQRHWRGSSNWCIDFLPVGFYYKTFHEKRTSWKFWEPIVRAMAGLGTIDPRRISIRAITTSSISLPMSR